MDEFALIDRWFRRDGGAGVVLGVGDDGAVLDVPAGRQLVAVVDTLVEGVHFLEDADAADVGYRAVAVNLSDIAAMGAVPAWMTLALTIESVNEHWLDGFAAGLYEAADAYDVSLVGGDTARGRETVLSVQLLGHVDPGRVLTRGGCRPGHAIYVSGTPGDAAAGLDGLRRGSPDAELRQRFLRPVPRVSLGQAVGGVASAAIDISDGLAADLEHILEASGCGAAIDTARLPLSDALLGYAGRQRAVEFALTGGDDYELCLAVPPERDAAFRAAAGDCGIAVTAIGEAVERPGLAITDDGRPVEGLPRGYRHFTARGEER